MEEDEVEVKTEEVRVYVLLLQYSQLTFLYHRFFALCYALIPSYGACNIFLECSAFFVRPVLHIINLLQANVSFRYPLKT